MLFALFSPAEALDGPAHFEEALTALHAALSAPLTLIHGVEQGQTGFYCRGAEADDDPLRRQLYGAYPQLWIHRRQESLFQPRPEQRLWSRELRLRPEMFPLAGYRERCDSTSGETVDPIRNLLTLIAPAKSQRIEARVELLVRPAARRRVRRANLRLAKWERSLLGRRSRQGEQAIQRANAKLSRPQFEARLRVVVAAESHQHTLALAKLNALSGALAGFARDDYHNFVWGRPRRAQRSLTDLTFSWLKRGFLLSAEEVATLFHPPAANVQTHKLQRAEFRLLEPPIGLPSGREEGSLPLARVRFHGRNEVFGLSRLDRRRHVWIGGKTGMGKSSLLKQMIVADIRAGRGVGLIDPHGDLAEEVLRLIPRRHINRVVLFDPADTAYPIAYNPLDCPDKRRIPLAASNILSVFKKQYEDVSWGPRLESILRNALLALLEVPDTSLASLWYLLTDVRYRNWVVREVENEFVRAFWLDKFNKWNERFRIEATEAVLNKIENFITNPILNNILGQPRNKLDLPRIIDEGGILVANLSKGGIGEDGSHLLGSLLVTGIQQAALARSQTTERLREDFYLYVDEFQNFATPSFATILAEARKYRLNLTVANQYLAQMPEETAAAVFGNVGTMIAFASGGRDAEVLAREMGGRATAHDLVNLPQYTAYANLMVGGKTSRTFSIATLKPEQPPASLQGVAKIRNVSRQRYATDKRKLVAGDTRARTLR